MSEGVNARDLSEDDLRRELAHAKEKTQDIEAGGTPHQRANLKDRTTQLEQEFLRRNPPPGAEDAPQAETGGETAGAPQAETGGETTGATADHSTTDGATNSGTTDRDATDDGADDSAPGAAADSSAPAVSGQPADDPNQPDNLV